MTVPAPHFLLYAEAALAADCDDSASARWRFVLRSHAGETALEAADEEPHASRERLELLAVIRGLESLDQPSRITLMTGSRCLQTGLESGLSQWRENNWQWERFGRMTPIKNADLWQRLDRLSAIHSLKCPRQGNKQPDDLAPPAIRTTKSGRQLRIDPGSPRGEKLQIAGTKSQTKSKARGWNDPNEQRSRPWNFRPWNLFGPWCLVIGPLNAFVRFLRTRFLTDYANSRGVSRAHHRVARRHERIARRPSGPAAGSARPADDPPRRT